MSYDIDKSKIFINKPRSVLSVAEHLNTFLTDIKNNSFTAVPTGFKSLDELLGGGLYPGLYVLGAMSSIGKTTFVTQIADLIAQNGTDVFIFSLEMSKNELIAKSLSRLTFIKCVENGLKPELAKSTLDILVGSKFNNYNEKEKELFNLALTEFRSYADKLFIEEGYVNFSCASIKSSVEAHIRTSERKPVVIVDYLQLLTHLEVSSDKQIVDRSIHELKRLSRDNKIPVVVISSFNRAAYGNKPISMDSFKESGNIEYTADVLIGLTLSDFDSKAKVHDARMTGLNDILLTILKNRNGAIDRPIIFHYVPQFNYFEELEDKKVKSH